MDVVAVVSTMYYCIWLENKFLFIYLKVSNLNPSFLFPYFIFNGLRNPWLKCYSAPHLSFSLSKIEMSLEPPKLKNVGFLHDQLLVILCGQIRWKEGVSLVGF